VVGSTANAAKLESTPQLTAYNAPESSEITPWAHCVEDGAALEVLLVDVSELLKLDAVVPVESDKTPELVSLIEAVLDDTDTPRPVSLDDEDDDVSDAPELAELERVDGFGTPLAELDMLENVILTGVIVDPRNVEIPDMLVPDKLEDGTLEEPDT